MPDEGGDWQRVCAKKDIDNPGAFGFDLCVGKYLVYGFIVQFEGQLKAYKNVCPHLGRQLDWALHRFLTKDNAHIICSAHGALFEPLTGLCVSGPCLGNALQSWEFKVAKQDILVRVPPTQNAG